MPTADLSNAFNEYCFLLGLRQTNIPQAARRALGENPARELRNNPVSSWRQVLPLSVHIYGVKKAAQLVRIPEPATEHSTSANPVEILLDARHWHKQLCVQATLHCSCCTAVNAQDTFLHDITSGDAQGVRYCVGALWQRADHTSPL